MKVAKMDQLIEEVSEYLDFDPRFWNKDDGQFEWGEVTVFYRKTPNSIFLFIDGVFYEAPRC